MDSTRTSDGQKYVYERPIELSAQLASRSPSNSRWQERPEYTFGGSSRLNVSPRSVPGQSWSSSSWSRQSDSRMNDRPRKDPTSASRSFEPSESWKQTHGTRNRVASSDKNWIAARHYSPEHSDAGKSTQLSASNGNSHASSSANVRYTQNTQCRSRSRSYSSRSYIDNGTYRAKQHTMSRNRSRSTHSSSRSSIASSRPTSPQRIIKKDSENEKVDIPPSTRMLTEPLEQQIRVKAEPETIDLSSQVLNAQYSVTDTQEDNDEHPTESEPPVVNSPVPEEPFDDPLLTFRPKPAVDFTESDIPRLTTGNSLNDVLRVVVMTRLLCDEQTVADRVEPVLKSNARLAALHANDISPLGADDLIREMTEGSVLEKRINTFLNIQEPLAHRFAKRQAALSDRVDRLRQEYLDLHRKWIAQCDTLDGPTRVNEGEAVVLPSKRSTRSRQFGVNLGDTARTDLEMAQIIARFTNDDATDPAQLSLKNLATIPDMISVTKGEIETVYDNTNLAVHDPLKYYAPSTGINDWTEEEKEIFLEKYATHPKQFGIISDYITHKTPEQCVAFYYLHKKRHIDFRKVVAQKAQYKRRKRRTNKGKGNALLADIMQHDADVGRNLESSIRRARTRAATRRSIATATPASTPTPDRDAMRVKPRRSNGAPSSRGTSTSAVAKRPASPPDNLDKNNDVHISINDDKPMKRLRRSRKVKSAAFITEDNDDEPAAEEWTKDDKERFLKFVEQYGDNLESIAAAMRDKTSSMISAFYKANYTNRVADKADPHTPSDHTSSKSTVSSSLITMTKTASTWSTFTGHNPFLPGQITRFGPGKPYLGPVNVPYMPGQTPYGYPHPTYTYPYTSAFASVSASEAGPSSSIRPSGTSSIRPSGSDAAYIPGHTPYSYYQPSQPLSKPGR